LNSISIQIVAPLYNVSVPPPYVLSTGANAPISNVADAVNVLAGASL